MEITGNIRFSRWKTALIILITISILPTLASSEEFYKFERMWPTLQQRWYFSKPRDIAVDSDGYVYMADSWNHRIQKFTTDGQFVTKWGKKVGRNGEFGEIPLLLLDE